MKRIRILSESKAVVFTVLIIIAVAITGIILFINLSDISKKVSNSIKTKSPASLITRQILNDISSAENNVSSFHLSRDTFYIKALFKTILGLEERIKGLKKLTSVNPGESVMIDSIITLTRERFDLIKIQIYEEDPVNIANELNLISRKIDETYRLQNELKISAANADTLNKIKAFFQRLFGKKNDLKNNDNNAKSSQAGNIGTKDQLKSTVLKVKTSQVKELSDFKQSSYRNTQEALRIMERLNFFADELKHSEDIRFAQESNQINEDVNKLKHYSILLSVVISCFLFMLVYLFIDYVKKKNEYESALVESKLRAENLAKAKETFLANMSHEIKTPLNAIYGFTEQILTGELNPEQEHQLKIVKSSAAYLTKLVNNILTYAKLQAGKSKPDITEMNIKKELLNVKELFSARVESKGVQFIFNIDETIPEVIKCDSNKIMQVIFNIVGNAIKFTDNGEVVVTLKNEETKEKDMIQLIVKDSGIGIAEDKLPRLFNEFEQGDELTFKKYGGTGLGLMITRQIVEQMGGAISISSKPGVGTTVFISIPVEFTAHHEIIKEKDALSLSELELLKDKRILIVDDEEFNRLLLSSILRKYQVVIFEALNGNEAVEMARNQALDMVIMDIRMPEKNGIDATEEIRKFEKTLPVLAAAAEIGEEMIAECLRSGINGFLFKPFMEKELLETVINLLKGYGSTENSTMQMEQKLEENKETKSIINLENINNIAGSDEAFKKEMIRIFHKSINNGIMQIEQYVKNEKYSDISEVAHKMIPSCRHFEAIALQALLKFFEELRNKDNTDLTEINKNLAELRGQVSLINNELAPYLS